MLNEGLDGPLHDSRGLAPTAAQGYSSIQPGSSITARPVTTSLQSLFAATTAHKVTAPRLGFGLQDIFVLDEEIATTPPPPKSPVAFQLGAGLGEFFEENDHLVYTPARRKAARHVPGTRKDTSYQPSVSNSHHHLRSASDVVLWDRESDSDSSVESFEDDTLVDESKPSTPETSLPFTPSPGDKTACQVHTPDHARATSDLAGPRLSSSIHVIDYEPQAHGTITAIQHDMSVTTTLATPAHSRLTNLSKTILLQDSDDSTPMTPGSIAGVSSYASLVASGPSIGDFTRLLASSPNIGLFPTPPSKPKPQPLLTRREQKWASLEAKLKHHIAVDTHSDADVHIYVDMSNIHIGFIDTWKLAHNVPISQRIKAPKFSFENLARILSRDRPVKEKHLAGSVAFPATRRSNWPKHMKDAASMGYAMKIMERVLKEKSPPKHFNTKTAGGYSSMYDAIYNFATTSADDSTEDNAPSYVSSRNGEQGVDEGLHVEMLTTVIDHKPGIMVLATGDGAEAEFSQGFKSYAIRAMKLGWDIEVCAWRKTISSAWSESAFLAEWGDQIRIIHLDPFLDELVAEIA